MRGRSAATGYPELTRGASRPPSSGRLPRRPVPEADHVAADAAPDDEISPLCVTRARAWFEEHRAQLRKNAYGHGFLYWMLAITFIVGLAAYIAGYLLKSSATTEPLGLLADMAYSFGFALWTPAIIVVLSRSFRKPRAAGQARLRGLRGVTAREGAEA